MKTQSKIQRPNRLQVTLLACTFAGVFTAASAGAQGYPAKPIRNILALGGAGETLARLIAEPVSQALGQPILVEAMPQATGAIAASTVARAAPDGYTLLYAATNSQIYRHFLAKNVPYDSVKDFTPIAMLSEAVLVLAVHPSGYKSAKDLIEAARRAPDKIFYSTSGVGTTHHMSAEILQGVAGVKMTHVPLKDAPAVALELISNRIPVGWSIFGSIIPHHTAGKIRIIAVNNTSRYSRVKDIPTLGEQVPGYVPPPGWNGYFGPAKLPRPIVDRLNAEIVKAVKAPELAPKLAAIGFIPTPSTPEELGEEVKRSLARAAKIVKDAGIQPE